MSAQTGESPGYGPDKSLANPLRLKADFLHVLKFHPYWLALKFGVFDRINHLEGLQFQI